MEIDYGKKVKVKPVDENGSTVTTSKNYLKGEIKRPVKNYYEIKVRVHSQEEEQKEYLSFSNQIARDNSMLDPAFKIESSRLGKDNGYYYVVKCWVDLEY